jgi:hypothetical protein
MATTTESRREILASCLAAGMTIRRTATKSGFSLRQASRLANDPAIVRRAAELRTQMIGQASGMLAAMVAKAIKRLEKLIDDPSSTVQRRAVKDAMEYALKFQERFDLSQEIREIKEGLAAKTGTEGDEYPG